MENAGGQDPSLAAVSRDSADAEGPRVAAANGSPRDGDLLESGVPVVATASRTNGHAPNGEAAEATRPSSVWAGRASAAAASEGVYESHFTLRIPTSTVHFRGHVLRVIDTDQDQIVLQQRVPGGVSKDFNGGDSGKDGRRKDGDGRPEKVLVKRLSPGTYANRALKIGYTLITILFLGFLFVFCFQVLLFLFIALPVDSGYTSGNAEVDSLAIIGTLLAFPVMLYGMASLMAMGSAFVVDTYNGAALFRSTVVEILYMFVFLVVPILMFAIGLMLKIEEPWRLAAGVWALTVLITFCAWGLAVTIKQIKACLWLVERNFCNEDDSSEEAERVMRADSDLLHLGQGGQRRDQWGKLGTIAKKAVLVSQTARYAGKKKVRYNVVTGSESASSLEGEAQETSIGLYSRLTAIAGFAFYTLDPPERIYSSEEVRDIQPFMTTNNFSMQQMWCSGGSRRHNVVVARGPSALTPDQIKYSVLCTMTSGALFSLLFVGALVWLEMGLGILIATIVILIVCCIYPMFRNASETYKLYGGVNDSVAGADDDAEANIFQVWEAFRITEPKLWYCYARILIEVVFLFLWPFINLLVTHNYPVAAIFFVLGGFTFLWRYFDANAALSELGSISDVADETVSHQAMYRMSEAIGRIITSSGRRWWSWIFSIFFVAILVLFLASQHSTDYVQPQERGPRPPILLVEDFYYPPQPDTLAYPTCKLAKGFEFPDETTSDLADYSFLSAMAYETSEVTSYTLTKWFGPDAVVDEEEFVAQFREDSGTTAIPVFFKLFSIPAFPGYAVMSIRGSETMFDWLVNMQLWSAAGLAQAVKWLTPFGWVWNPILPDLVTIVNKVQSDAIASVAYYKVTSMFVDWVLGGYGGGQFSDIHVTGASLGGGLAIITGAQTDAYAVAISGLGAVLSRDTLDPPVELDRLNSQTFNFIPERDYIARIGGRSQLFQNGQCIAPTNSLFGCHSMWRSVCEINYRCGSMGRPVPCRCVWSMGYPEPVQNGTRSFEEACNQENATWYELGFGG
ncbi:hypothetical protein ACHAXT_008671 [Thalassiosira profunda]